jgi:FkbM family methyltransferase
LSPKGDEAAPRREIPRFVQKRTAFYDSASRITPFLGTRAGQGVFMVRTEDKHIGRSLFGKQGRGEMTVLTRAVNVLHALFGPEAVEGRVFIDVGANIGTTTVPAVLEHGFGSAVAIEPEPDNYLTLRINALLNGLDDRVAAFQLAASNQVGTSELVVNRQRGGKHWIATDEDKKQIANADDQIEVVETTTLDQLASDRVFDPDDTGLLWIDAQAHEGHILEGATAITSRGVPIVLEWDPKALDEVGDRTKIQRIAEEHYTHFAGMRADSSGDGPKFWLRPVAALGDYAERFLDPSREETFTDILILRLSAHEIPDDRMDGAVDLAAVIRRQSMLRPGRLVRDDVAGEESPVAEPVAPTARLRARERQRALRRKAQRAEVKAVRAKEKLSRLPVAGGAPSAPQDASQVGGEQGLSSPARTTPAAAVKRPESTGPGVGAGGASSPLPARRDGESREPPAADE